MKYVKFGHGKWKQLLGQGESFYGLNVPSTTRVYITLEVKKDADWQVREWKEWTGWKNPEANRCLGQKGF